MFNCSTFYCSSTSNIISRLNNLIDRFNLLLNHIYILKQDLIKEINGILDKIDKINKNIDSIKSNLRNYIFAQLAEQTVDFNISFLEMLTDELALQNSAEFIYWYN